MLTEQQARTLVEKHPEEVIQLLVTLSQWYDRFHLFFGTWSSEDEEYYRNDVLDKYRELSLLSLRDTKPWRGDYFPFYWTEPKENRNAKRS